MSLLQYNGSFKSSVGCLCLETKALPLFLKTEPIVGYDTQNSLEIEEELKIKWCVVRCKAPLIENPFLCKITLSTFTC